MQHMCAHHAGCAVPYVNIQPEKGSKRAKLRQKGLKSGGFVFDYELARDLLLI